MKTLALFLPAASVLAVVLATSAARDTTTPAPAWKAAAASARITPETMMWMAGYAGRTKPAEGVDQDLFAKTLIIEDLSGGRLAMITLDLIGVPRDLRLNVAARLQKEQGLDPSRLLINASHTHSGPELRASRTDGSDEPTKRADEAAAYTAKLEDKLVSMVADAIKRLEPATLQYSRARCGFAMNRRTPSPTGFKNFPNPNGPVDHTVPVLKVTSAAGKDLAIAFGYNCHCTVLGGQRFSGDYAGYAQEYLQQAHPDTVAMFVNGCSGDQNPYPRRTTELAQTHGRSLATAVQAALETEMTTLTGSIQAAYKEIPLAYDKLPTREELNERLQSKTKLDADHARRVLARLDAEGRLPQTYPYPVQVLRLGSDLTMIPLGGEVVIDYALRLKKEIQDPIVWMAGYSNDVMTYIPSRRVWEEGGYEGGDAMKWGTHPTRWSADAEEHIVKTVHELRDSLK